MQRKKLSSNSDDKEIVEIDDKLTEKMQRE